VTADLSGSVRRALFWRSGSQIVSQIVSWGATLAVVRILQPEDYGLFAMTQVVLSFLSFLNGYGFASSLVKEKTLDHRAVRQGFGLLLMVNGALAVLQLLIAPLVATYYRQPLIADLLRVQALIYLTIPFIAIPEALMVRDLDFRRPAIANFAASIAMAGTSLGCALAGLGVWTLVWAPLAMFWTRAAALVMQSHFRVVPSFDLRGAGGMLNFGMLLLGSHFFWTVQTQADIFIAGRSLDPHELGLYAEALFLTMLVANKFVPPLNDVAFPAYARLQDDRAALSAAFCKSVRLIMLVTMPLYLGLGVTAEPAVLTIFGEKWRAMAPMVAVISLAMPAFTLHILFAPAINALGHARINLRTSILGAVVMIAAFLVGVRYGAMGLAWAWVIAFPVMPLATFLQARHLLGVSATDLARAILPAMGAAAAMAALVRFLAVGLETTPAWASLLAQAGFGGLAYAAIIFVFSRSTLNEMMALVIRRRPPPELAPA
jgi:O-antigen/teichoic acid export membrane protein